MKQVSYIDFEKSPSSDFVVRGRPLRGQTRLAPLAMRSTCSKSSKLHCLGRGDYLAFSRDACIVERQMTWQTTFLSKKSRQTTFKKPNLEAFHLRLISEVSTHKLQVLIRTLLASILTLVITKGYGARATTIAGQNALAPRLCFPYGSRDRWIRLPVIKGRNVLYNPFILTGSPNKAGYIHAMHA